MFRFEKRPELIDLTAGPAPIIGFSSHSRAIATGLDQGSCTSPFTDRRGEPAHIFQPDNDH
jgi:hypothetical protein